MINKLLFSYNSFAISRTFESRVKTLLNMSNISDLIWLVFCIPDHIWQLLETLDDLGPPGLEADPVLGHDQGEHGEGEHLAGVGLGRGNSDLRAGVDVDATVRLTADGGTNLVEVFFCKCLSSVWAGLTVLVIPTMRAPRDLQYLQRWQFKHFWSYPTLMSNCHCSCELPECPQSISSFSWLADEEADIVPNNENIKT